MLHSTDPDRIGSKEGLWGDVWISLKRGNRDSVNGLWVSGDGNMSNQIGRGMEERVLKETNRKGGISGSGTNLVQGNLPGTYKDDFQ